MRSLGDRIRETRGRTSGFDYMRICLAAGVIAAHSTKVSYGPQADTLLWSGPQIILPNFIVPMFFALSGFLVTGSLERCPTLISFYGLRILRIVPALVGEVTLSALIVGPILSSFGVATYFTSPELYAYFMNILGDIHYHLPGLFLSNPISGIVNGQLWTIPFELQCYIALGGLAVAGIVKNPRRLLVVVAIGQVLWIWQAIKRGDVGYWLGPSGPVLVLYFLIGVLIFLYRDSIPFSKKLAALAAIACVVLLDAPHGSFYFSVPVAYLTIYLWLLNPPRNKYVLAGDFSYGIYLYGFPIQQVAVSLGPWAHHWYINLLISLPAAIVAACLSWFVIEKRALALRRYLPQIEKTVATLRGMPTIATKAAAGT